jgi:uncharacterized protein YbjT (DUF2867 family)
MPNPPRRLVLVCGATGNVGSAAVRALARHAVPARALVRPGTDATPLIEVGVDVARGDIRDPISIAAALEGVTTVICAVTALTRHMGGEHPLRVRDVDRWGVISLIEAAEAAGVERLVSVSASRRYSNARCAVIDAANAVAARLARSSIRIVTVRSEPHAELWFSRDVGFEPDQGRVRIFGKGRNPVRFTSTDDVGAAAAALAVAGDPPALLELGGPEALSILDAVSLAESITGRHVERRHIPRAALRLASRTLRRIRPELASAMAFGLALDTSASDVGPEGFAQVGIEPRSASESLGRMVAPAPRASEAVTSA